MSTRPAIRRLLAGLATLALLGGCASTSTPSPVPTAVPSGTPVPTTSLPPPGPSVAPAWTPAAAPATYGPVTVVEGIATPISGDLGTVTTDADGNEHSRGGTFSLEETMNDPRVSGIHTVNGLAMDRWGTGPADGASVQWGAERIVNDGGVWEGWGSGIWSTDRGDIVVVWFKGTGGYAGLSYFYLTDSIDVSGGFTDHYRVRGQISPGDPPTP